MHKCILLRAHRFLRCRRGPTVLKTLIFAKKMRETLLTDRRLASAERPRASPRCAGSRAPADRIGFGRKPGSAEAAVFFSAHGRRMFSLRSPKKSYITRAGLPDFSCHNIPERGKIYQITTKYTKWP
jgi:hypothetical protein